MKIGSSRLMRLLLPLLPLLSLYLEGCKSSSLVSSSEISATANPEGGRYTSVQKVTLLAAKAKGSKIYYTLDGTEPFENPNALLYSAPIAIGDPEVNQSLTLRFYTVDSAGFAGENTYTENYHIVVDEIPPIIKPNILHGVFSRNISIKISANEPVVSSYCVSPKNSNEECAATDCIPNITYTANSSIDVFGKVSDLDIKKFCLLIAAIDRSKNKSSISAYSYTYDGRVPFLQCDGSLENRLEPDNFLNLNFKTSTAPSLEGKSGSSLAQSDLTVSELINAESDALLNAPVSAKPAYKFMAKVSNNELVNPMEALGQAQDQMLNGNTSSLDLGFFGSSLFSTFFRLIKFPEQIWQQGSGLEILSGQFDLNFVGADYVGQQKAALNWGSNNLTVFVIDDSVFPPAVSFLVTKIEQSPALIDSSLKVAAISSQALTSDDNKYQMISTTLDGDD